MGKATCQRNHYSGVPTNSSPCGENYSVRSINCTLDAQVFRRFTAAELRLPPNNTPQMLLSRDNHKYMYLEWTQ